MQQSYYGFQNHDFNIQIDKMPIWFKEARVSGDKDQGTITLHTSNTYDDIWGPIGTMEIHWEKKDRMDSFHAKQVQNSIDMYNSIEIVVTKKEDLWVRAHECTIWYGHRAKIIRKHFYRESVIHCVLYCDITERQYNIHTSIITDHYEGFKPYIVEAYNTIICHD